MQQVVPMMLCFATLGVRISFLLYPVFGLLANHVHVFSWITHGNSSNVLAEAMQFGPIAPLRNQHVSTLINLNIIICNVAS